MFPSPQFALWILPLISIASTLAETDIANTNITTLYPVSNRNISRNDIRTRFSDPQTKPSTTETIVNKTESAMNNVEPNKTEAKKNLPTQTWKIESSFAPSNLTEVNNKTKDTKQLLKDFKPSQHLGSFFDDENAELIRTPAVGPVAKKPASGFLSSPKEVYYQHPSHNYIPKDIYYTHEEFPYKFEDTIYTKTREGWQDSLDSKPTVEAPVKVPAGGLYKSPEAFKDKPQSAEEYGLEYHEEEKEHAIKKRVNPWQNLLRLVTAFIPVGLIISALTPSVITIHNVDDNINTLPVPGIEHETHCPAVALATIDQRGSQQSKPYRRSDPGVTNMAPISERCRRRLLCELHSEKNYVPPRTLPRRTMKQCYKIHCEDTDALWKMLRWLFTYNQEPGDQRGRLIT
uniref:SFRICE_007847 n=1 Tax=Spodoptera frugiperda TaxID=7108 RepID=A0A2H1VJF4_SPOFR